jgi:peptide/nickel transport system ATP-binding protein
MEKETSPRAQEDLLTIKGLKVTFHTYAGDVKALDGVELSVKKGEILGLVGESGCGKSVTALSVAGLLPSNAEIASGEVLLDGVDLTKMTSSSMRKARLKDIAIVFQDPTTYLNPVLTIGSQITEILTEDRNAFAEDLVSDRLQEIDRMSAEGASSDLREERERLEALRKEGKMGWREARRLARLYAMKFLELVKLPEPERVIKTYPFELSGGMKQRAMIAMALVRRPKIFLADEITTGLDVTVQAQILELLKELREQIESSIILVTHDLAVVAAVCDRVAVMYAGNIVEVAEVNELFRNPLHPYTHGLLACIPRPDFAMGEMKSIGGSIPDLIYPPSGCRFHPRCSEAFGRCPKEKPRLVEISPGHLVACFLYGGDQS